MRLESRHLSVKKHSFEIRDCSISLKSSASGIVLHVIGDGCNFKIPVSERIKLYTTNDGFSFRNSTTKSILRVFEDDDKSLFKALQNQSSAERFEGALVGRGESVQNSLSSDNSRKRMLSKESKSIIVQRKVLRRDLEEKVSRPMPKPKAITSTPLRQNTANIDNNTRALIPSPWRQQPLNQGFKNLGHTCYISAVLQLLLHSKVSKRILAARDHLKSKGLGDLEFMDAMCDLIQRKLSGRELDISWIRNCLLKLAPQFEIFVQQDAHEFLITCLSLSSFGSLPKETTNMKYDPLNQFRFQIENILTCIECSHESLRRETDYILSLALRRSDDENPIDLPSLIRTYFETEQLEYNCENCCGRKATLRHVLKTLPGTLILHLIRFETSSSTVQKKNDPVLITTQILDNSYALRGVVAHLGYSMTGGHYVYYHQQADGLFTKFDDDSVTQNGRLKMESMSAYLLIYDRINL